MSPSDTWNTVALLSSGQCRELAPADIRVVADQHYAVPAVFGSNPITIQFPCSGKPDRGSVGESAATIFPDHRQQQQRLQFHWASRSVSAPPGSAIFHADNVVCYSNLQLQVSTTGSNTRGALTACFTIFRAAASPSTHRHGNRKSDLSGKRLNRIRNAKHTNGLVIAMPLSNRIPLPESRRALFDAG